MMIRQNRTELIVPLLKPNFMKNSLMFISFSFSACSRIIFYYTTSQTQSLTVLPQIKVPSILFFRKTISAICSISIHIQTIYLVTYVYRKMRRSGETVFHREIHFYYGTKNRRIQTSCYVDTTGQRG